MYPTMSSISFSSATSLASHTLRLTSSSSSKFSIFSPSASSEASMFAGVMGISSLVSTTGGVEPHSLGGLLVAQDGRQASSLSGESL